MILIDNTRSKSYVKSCKSNIIFIKDGWYQLLIRDHPEKIIFFKWDDYIKDGKRMPTKELSIFIERRECENK